MNLNQPAELKMEVQFSAGFLQGMIDRMLVSAFKYGDFRNAYPSKVNALKSLQQRLDKYNKTKNTEFLIDAANFCMIEFMRPSVEGAHFEPTDSRESPGRTWRSGVVGQGANTPELQEKHDNAKRRTLGGFRE